MGGLDMQFLGSQQKNRRVRLALRQVASTDIGSERVQQALT
jgi:hypothetical protein